MRSVPSEKTTPSSHKTISDHNMFSRVSVARIQPICITLTLPASRNTRVCIRICQTVVMTAGDTSESELATCSPSAAIAAPGASGVRPSVPTANPRGKNPQNQESWVDKFGDLHLEGTRPFEISISLGRNSNFIGFLLCGFGVRGRGLAEFL